MKYHAMTALAFAIAMALYALGMNGGGNAFLFVGGAIELWAWRRVLDAAWRRIARR